jgi:hypothetical protein
MKRFCFAMLVTFLISTATAGAATTVPGHTGSRVDGNENGIPDVGVVVVGHYNSYYAEDGSGDYYWDLGDGRIYKTVESVADLDQATLTECDYVVNYRGTFEDDPFMDTGTITNNIHCYGYEPGTYYYQIVDETNPRYTGNPDWAEWGSWEYHVLTVSGAGNLVRPMTHVG